MKTLLRLATIALFSASAAFADDVRWIGEISDSNCGASHKSTIEHSGKTMSDADCTAACVKGGAKYVFVYEGKVYKIENQDASGLTEAAGKTVKISGTITGDTIKVTRVHKGLQKQKAAS
jgi:hypothetical protein